MITKGQKINDRYEVIRSIGEGSVEEKVMKLIRKANNRGGTDNISVAYLVRFEEGEDK